MKLLKFLMGVLAAATVSTINSCEKEPENQLPTNIKEDLTFTLTISEVTYNSAQIRVKHDGSESDTWYGFLTDAPKSKKDAALIVEKLAELTANGGLKGLENKKTKRVSFEDLRAGTTYRYIVFGLTPEGLPYGNTNSIEFKTEESSFLLSTVEDWTIAYVERNKEKNMETYSVQFNKNNAPRCHVGFIPKWMVEEYEKQEGIKEELETYGGLRLTFGEGEDAGVYLFSVLDYLVFEELFEYWGYYDGDDAYFTNETFNESSVIELPRQASGEYYAVAIGFTDGQPTWTYSVNDVTIEKETPSADYTSWLGNWTITGKNNITYKLKFEENDPNFSYYVYGWECSESIHSKDCEENCSEHDVYTDFSKYQLGIPFYFNALNGNLYIKSTLLNAQAAPESDVVYYWGMFGCMEYQGQTVSILTPEDLIAEASLPTTDAWSTSLNGLSSTTYNVDASGNTNEVKFTYNSFSYLQYDDKEYKTLTWNRPMQLPASLVKEAASPSASVAKSGESSKRKECAIKSYRKIKSADYSRLNKVKPETIKQVIF